MTRKRRKNDPLTPDSLCKYFKERPIRLQQIKTGDSVSVDTGGDIHFFHCLFSAQKRPPKKCKGWRGADTYPYRVYYKAIDYDLTVQLDIDKLICPRDCTKDCRILYWEKWDKKPKKYIVIEEC